MSRPASFWFVMLLVISAMSVGWGQEGERKVLTFEEPRTAVLDPVNWDEVMTGELYFDALRPLLVRFPGLADRVYAEMEGGYRVESVRLGLRWEKTEGARPQRGRHGWGAEKAYENNPGKWHAVVWPVRKAWRGAPEKLGPTFNSSIRETVFWHRGGARDEERDVGPHRFGPVPLHVDSPEAQIDLTPLVKAEIYGESLPERLRRLDDRGVLLLKDELFDLKYRGGASYHWQMSTGYMRIWVKKPVLTVVLRRAEGVAPGPLPPPADIDEIAGNPGDRGAERPSIYYPENLPELADKYTSRPEGLEDWQWEHLQRLRRIGLAEARGKFPDGMRGVGGDVLSMFQLGLLEGGREDYLALIKSLMGLPPRHFAGHPTSGYAVVPAAWGELLPPGAIDHLKLYWKAFTHPEVEDTKTLPKGPWRNYFRGYCTTLSTQNFNYNSIAGTLLAGQLLDEPYVLSDARWGIENLMLRTYGVYDGSFQEMGETYYLAITLGGASIVHKWAERPQDRLMGKIARDRLMEPLISAYHPGLRRIVFPQGRGAIPKQLLFQDGPYQALHTLSPGGAMLHLEEAEEHVEGGEKGRAGMHGIPILGSEAPPDRMALFQPWGESHLAEMVDEKPLPWQVRARHWARQPQSTTPGWHTTYLSEHYGIASRECGSVAPVLAHWRRGPEKVDHIHDLSTLMLSAGANGQFKRSAGFFGSLHHENSVLALRVLRAPGRGWPVRNGEVRSLHSSLALVAFGDTSGREVWVNDRRVEALSGARKDPGGSWEKRLSSAGAKVSARDGDVIAIRDGVSYVGVVPVSAHTPERKRQAQISFEYPVLLIHSYVYDAEEAMDADAFYGREEVPTSGFAIRMGDASQDGSFAEFRREMMDSRPRTEWDGERRILRVAWEAGDDSLEMGFRPRVHKYATPHAMGPKPAYRRINGQWPPIPEDVHRDTPWSVQGYGGRIEKGGAAVEAEVGRRIYLQADPRQGIYTGYNVLPDGTLWRMIVPGGIEVAADGRIGVARVQVRAAANRVQVETAPGERLARREDRARSLLVFGMDGEPEVTLNGAPLENGPTTVIVEGRRAHVVPLEEGGVDGAGDRYLAARRALQANHGPDVQESYLQDWSIAGPFPAGEKGSGMEVIYGPEKNASVDAAYTGKDGAEVGWQAVREAGDGPLGSEPVDLLQFFPEEQNAVGYAQSGIVSDRERDAWLYLGLEELGRIYVGWSEELFEVYLNGERIFSGNAHECGRRDQWKFDVHLEKGVNRILVKYLRSRAEGWNLSLRVGDRWGIPITDGISYGWRGQ